MIVVTADGLIKDVDAFLATDAGAWRLRLLQGNAPLTKFSHMTDWAELTFAGYAGHPLNTWTPAVLNASNQAQSTGNSITFQPTSPSGLPQTANLYAIDNGSGDMLWGELIGGGFTFVDVLSALTIIPTYSADDLV